MCTMGADGCWACASTGWVQQSERERESKLLIQAFSASSCHIKAPNQSCKLVCSSTRLPNDKEEQPNMRWRGNVLWLKWEADGGKRWGDVPVLTYCLMGWAWVRVKAMRSLSSEKGEGSCWLLFVTVEPNRLSYGKLSLKPLHLCVCVGGGRC